MVKSKFTLEQMQLVPESIKTSISTTELPQTQRPPPDISYLEAEIPRCSQDVPKLLWKNQLIQSLQEDNVFKKIIGKLTIMIYKWGGY